MKSSATAADYSKDVASHFSVKMPVAWHSVTNGNHVEMTYIKEGSAIERFVREGVKTNRHICVTDERLRSSRKHARVVRIRQ